MLPALRKKRSPKMSDYRKLKPTDFKSLEFASTVDEARSAAPDNETTYITVEKN
ncbi:hypothetical protein BH11PSE11_BH11PSE11_23380 [soil metagenome]